MNTSFKLGKVSIPVDVETGAVFEIEGIEMSVTDFDIKEGLSVLKAIPGILRDLKSAFEEEAAPAKNKVEEVKGNLDSFIKAASALKAMKTGIHPGKAFEEGDTLGFTGHPLFGGINVIKVKHNNPNPFGGLGGSVKDDAPFKTISEFINSAMQLKKEQEGNKPVNPLEAFFKGEMNLGDLGKNLDKEI